jgi:hypothetical protein
MIYTIKRTNVKAVIDLPSSDLVMMGAFIFFGVVADQHILHCRRWIAADGGQVQSSRGIAETSGAIVGGAG